MFKCDHDYCPHLHFKKCLNARLQSIPYTIFPDGTIDSFTNVPMRCAKLYKSNVPTLAYQNYTLANGSVDDDRNFVKDYYLTKNKQCDNMANTIVKEQVESMCSRSAYVLADSEIQKHEKYQREKKNNLDNARRRAISRYNQHFAEKDRKKQQQDEENSKWLKKLYRKLEEVARHIIEGQGENASQRQKQFLLSKTNLNAAYLSQIKVRNPKVAFELLQQIRTLMLKKKLKFQEEREEQQHNKSVTMSFASQSGISGNTSQNSMMSEATSLNESNIFGEEQVVNKFCNFEELKKKWKVEDIEQVREILRRVLTRKIVSDAELEAVKKRKQAQKNNDKIKDMLEKQGKSIPSSARKNQKQKKKNVSVSMKVQTTVIDKNNLTKMQTQTKSTLIKGGQFDAVGEKFERNRNYSEMFRSRENANTVEFVYKNRILSFRDDCCCSTQA